MTRQRNRADERYDNHGYESDQSREDSHWPHSDDAETSLLGSLLIAGISDPGALLRVRRLVRPDDCHTEAHRVLLTAMFDMADAGVPLDLVTLIEHLRRRKLLDEVGGASAISELATSVPTSYNAEAYARAVANTGALRRLLAVSAKIAALAVHEPDARAAFQQAQTLLQQIASGSLLSKQDARSYGVLLDALFTDILDRMERPAGGIQTGMPSLDVQLGGLEPGDLIYLCGRPGSGKSALGVALATGIARRFLREWEDRQMPQIHPTTGEVLAPDPADTLPQAVDIVTLEMSDLHQVRRIVAAVTSINTRALRAGFRLPDGRIDVEGYQTAKARAYADKAQLERTLFIYGRPITMEELRSYVLNAIATRNLQVLVIDQLDLISDEPMTSRAKLDEMQRITRFSRMLNQLAKEVGIVIICLAQLNRNVEQRQNKRPMLSDLRSSGQLEQDADLVLSLYRGAYYDAVRARRDVAFAQFAEVGLLKVREGEANVMTPLRYEGAFTRFGEWPSDWEWPADDTRGMEG